MKKTLSLAGVLAGVLVCGCGEEEGSVAGTRSSEPVERETLEPIRQNPGEGRERSSDGTGDGSQGGGEEPGPEVAKQSEVQSLAAEMIAQLGELAAALTAVEDEATAGHVAKLAPQAAENIRSIATRLEKLPVPSEEIRTRINAEMDTQLEELGRSVGGQEEFLAKLSETTRPVVQAAMQTFIVAIQETTPVTNRYFKVQKEVPTELPEPPDPNSPPEPPIDPAEGSPVAVPAPGTDGPGNP